MTLNKIDRFWFQYSSWTLSFLSVNLYCTSSLFFFSHLVHLILSFYRIPSFCGFRLLLLTDNWFQTTCTPSNLRLSYLKIWNDLELILRLLLFWFVAVAVNYSLHCIFCKVYETYINQSKVFFCYMYGETYIIILLYHGYLGNCSYLPYLKILLLNLSKIYIFQNHGSIQFFSEIW